MCARIEISYLHTWIKLRGSGVQSVSPDADGGQGSMQCVRDLKHGERVHIHAWLKNKP